LNQHWNLKITSWWRFLPGKEQIWFKNTQNYLWKASTLLDTSLIRLLWENTNWVILWYYSVSHRQHFISFNNTIKSKIWRMGLETLFDNKIRGFCKIISWNGDWFKQSLTSSYAYLLYLITKEKIRKKLNYKLVYTKIK
jgi:hypothetical protein